MAGNISFAIRSGKKFLGAGIYRHAGPFLQTSPNWL